jgi:hypothetical protein
MMMLSFKMAQKKVFLSWFKELNKNVTFQSPPFFRK